MSPLCSLAAPWETGQPTVECYGLMLAFSPDSKLEYSLRNFLAFTSPESWGLVVGYTPKSKRSVFKVVAALGLMPPPPHTHPHTHTRWGHHRARPAGLFLLSSSATLVTLK